jgi:ABC-type nitrate/sulfonate/bicarbonate transport system permease component
MTRLSSLFDQWQTMVACERRKGADSKTAKERAGMSSLWLWTGIVFLAGGSAMGSAEYGLAGGLAGLFFGLVVSFAALYSIFTSVEPPPAAETSAALESREAARFPLSNCLWGLLSFAAGAVAYTVASAIASGDPIVARIVPPMLYDMLYAIVPGGLSIPPLRMDFSLLPDLLRTVDKALSAFQIGIPIAATLAFFTALVRPRRKGLRISGIGWIPVVAASMPVFIGLFGLNRSPQVGFAATAVTLAGLSGFIRPNEELASERPSSPAATGRVLFLVLEAVYMCLVAALASVIAMEIISGTDGVGAVIAQSVQYFQPERTVAAVALVWLAAALLSFVTRCVQSIVVEVTAGDRTGP